jgi:hypothetical protein
MRSSCHSCFWQNLFVFMQRHAMVDAHMSSPYDQFAKQLVCAALQTRGVVETNVEVPADTHRIDLWFTPRSDARVGPTTMVDHAERSGEADSRRPGVLRDTQDIVENWRREAIQQGVERGRASSLIDIYEARFGAMPDDVRAVVEDTHDEPTLRAWVRLASTRGANEIAATIRASRAS